MARSSLRHGYFEQAANCWQQVLSQYPQDAQAREMLACFAPVHAEPAADLPSPAPPSAANSVDSIAALCARCQALAQAGDVRTAESLLSQALQAHPGELRLREPWEELHLTQARQRLQFARRQAQHTAHPQAQRLVSQLEDDLLRHEIEFFSIRARRYPLEAQWSLELAIRLKRSGNYAEAVRLLREVPADGPRSARVAFEIGECLQFQRRFREALESYTEAVRRLALRPPVPSEDWERTALYRAGTLAHDLGFLEQAADHLRQLVKLAPDHEDVQQRLDKLADIRHKD